MNATRIAFAALLGRRLPQHSGSVSVPCREGVEIRRDSMGVAYVDAENESDVWFGLGFCHAQDRGGQLEVTLRLVRGTLASVVGPEALDIDRASRLLGVRRAAEAQLAGYDADVAAQLTAYCAGINAAMAAPGARRSHEHVLLRCAPSAWEPADVVGYGLLMCCLLPSNWDVELARLFVWMLDGAEAVEALDPSYPEELPVSYPPGQRSGPPADRFVAHDLLKLRELMGGAGGSNAWAVSGDRSASGRPLLANDPHLPASLPNFGYLARLKCPTFALAGVSIVGIPAFISGHNGHAAWGSTAANVDNTDLFLEELAADGRSVREGDAFVPCERRTELIAIKGRAPELLAVVSTRRGPIVARKSSPSTSIFRPVPFEGAANAISFSATWLRNAPTRGLLVMHKVRSFAAFRAACAQSTGSAYSLIYADPSTIGWLLAAEVPRRKQGFGSLPTPGWQADAGWEPNVVGSEQLPHGCNPSTGYVAAANNKPVPDSDTAVFLGHDFLDGYRQQRITALLAGRSDWTVARFLELQLDVYSLAWAAIRETVLALTPREPRAERALALLGSWDGHVTAPSVAASVYELFMGEVCQRLCRSKAPRSWQYAAGVGVMKLIPGTTFNARRQGFVVRLIRERPAGYFACWESSLLDILGHVVGVLEDRFGNDPQRWAWGAIRPLCVRHRFGGKPPLAQVYDLEPLPGYGDGGTVNQAGFEFWNPLRHSTVTAHLRTVIAVGDWENSRFVLLGGQSGNPFSAHYASLVPIWRRGEGVPIHWDDARVREQSTELLRLTPRSTAGPLQAGGAA